MEEVSSNSKEYSLKHLSEDEKQLVIKNYLNEVKTCKSILCEHWFKGFCGFTTEMCKYAHGLSDLQYVRAAERPANLKAYIKDDEVFNMKYDLRNYQYLKKYVEKLRVEGTLSPDEDFTLDELNQHSSKRSKVRTRFEKEFVLELMSFFFAENAQKVFLSKNFLEREFQLIRFPKKFDWIFNSDFYFVNDVAMPPRIKNSFKLVLPYPSMSLLEKNFKNLLREIITELKEKGTVEITEKTMTAEFYKKKVFDLPPLHVMLKKVNKSMEEYVKEIQTENSEEESIFVSKKAQDQKFQQNLDKILQDFWDDQRNNMFGFAKLNDFMESLHKRNFMDLGKEIYYHESHLVDFLKIYLMRKNVFLVFLFSETFLLNLTLLQKKSEKTFLESLQLKKIKSQQSEEEEFKHEEFLLKLKIQESEETDPELINSRIVIVNDEKSLIYSQKILAHCSAMGVDIEGHLYEGGRIDLIQIGIQIEEKRKIFIFDIHQIKLTNENLHKETKVFLKGLMQNPKIAKVFHDCRKDSLALHLFLDQTCPNNVYDTACLHILIEHLKVSKEFSKETDEKKQLEAIRYLENLPWPGLNVVLVEYEATHGKNALKEKMKKKFNEAPRSYFLCRPIDPEFVEYSAKDVEDLVEVFEKQGQKIENLFLELNVDIRQIFVKNFLMEKISYYYVKAGCTCIQK